MASLSPSPSHHDQQIASVLTGYVDGVAPLEDLLLRYQVARHEVEDLIELSDDLRAILIDVLPSPAFVAQLYDALVGQSSAMTMWNRVQAMPPRMKLAAGIGGITITAGVAGVLLITARTLRNRFDILNRAETPGKAIA
ncbi:MAG: hypothetical protein JW910_17360 [Anaerolineae bacterium]|nr:hypothetical protein [Anaerolineae bacterium]